LSLPRVKLRSVDEPLDELRVPVTADTVAAEVQARLKERVPLPDAGERSTLALAASPALIVTAFVPERMTLLEESRPLTVKVQEPVGRFVNEKDPLLELCWAALTPVELVPEAV
jgi:hypothetical protein